MERTNRYSGIPNNGAQWISGGSASKGSHLAVVLPNLVDLPEIQIKRQCWGLFFELTGGIKLIYPECLQFMANSTQAGK